VAFGHQRKKGGRGSDAKLPRINDSIGRVSAKPIVKVFTNQGTKL
jgi:hypothetical protein